MNSRYAPRQKSVMRAGQHQFGQVPRADIPRSSFDLSHGYKTTFDADYLIPCGVWDVIPGDSWNVKTTVMARLATPLYPLMDNLYIDMFYFFVPYRILWNSAEGSWERFCGAQIDPGDSIDFTIPTYASGAAPSVASIWDYMGLPLVTNVRENASALPLRAYNLIFNEWFRDQNLTDSAVVDLDNGPDTTTNYLLRKRCKKHDYFTSALPWPQKGDDPISLPLGSVAPIIGLGVTEGGLDGNAPIDILETGQTFGTGTPYPWANLTTTQPLIYAMSAEDDASPLIYADLSTATAATINELRLAFQTQRLLERDARSGTRYVETLKAHWGVTFPDYTAQRPIYLGGGSQNINITPVPQTTYQGTETDQDAKGALAAYGTSVGQHGFTRSFVEHGVILAIINARGDITYSQGIDRYWNKSTRYDFYYPVLAGIGEQAILNREIFYDNDPGTGAEQDDGVFGYTGRYNEYRFQNSKLTALMRPDASGTLAAWNLSEDFSSLPALGNTFIQANTGTPLDRAIAVPTAPHFICDMFHDIKAARPLPLYGVPGGIDHF